MCKTISVQKFKKEIIVFDPTFLLLHVPFHLVLSYFNSLFISNII